MLKYLSILLFIILIYLARNKIVEPLGPIALRDDSPKPELIEEHIEQYITNNRIDYTKLNKDINNIERQYQQLYSDISDMKFTIGYVENTLRQHEDASMNIGGSYPKDIQLNFYFPPPLPGNAGEKGEKGKKGRTGQKGTSGQRGVVGGNNYC